MKTIQAIAVAVAITTTSAASAGADWDTIARSLGIACKTEELLSVATGLIQNSDQMGLAMMISRRDCAMFEKGGKIRVLGGGFASGWSGIERVYIYKRGFTGVTYRKLISDP